MQNGENLIIGQDSLARCAWCGDDPLYVQYHDTEWGRPVYDDTRLFEKLCLEGFQAGLSWITILRKREHFRTAFDGFDIHTVARYDQKDVQCLLQNSNIIRHRGKIEATINNAQRALELMDEKGSLSGYFWSFSPESGQKPGSISDIPTHTPESAALSKDLKTRGWRFIGPIIAYSFMQAMGLVNDHLTECYCRSEK